MFMLELSVVSQIMNLLTIIATGIVMSAKSKAENYTPQMVVICLPIITLINHRNADLDN